MPILSHGQFTVSINSSRSAFIQSDSAKFTFYALAPIVGVIAFGLCLLAFRFHRRLDPAYSAAKLWALAPAFAGLVIFFLFSNNQMAFFAYPPAIVTLVLAVWRWRRAASVLSTFLYALAAIFCLNVVVALAIAGSFAEMGAFLLLNIFLGGLFALPICIVRTFVRSRVTGLRLFCGYVVTTIIPFAPFVIFLYLQDVSTIELFYPAGFISLLTLPLILLIRWNAWARDVATGAMFAPPKTME